MKEATRGWAPTRWLLLSERAGMLLPLRQRPQKTTRIAAAVMGLQGAPPLRVTHLARYGSKALKAGREPSGPSAQARTVLELRFKEEIS